MAERVLVVGGAGAIGGACVEALVARGAQVVVGDLDGEATEAVARRTGAAGSVAVDVRDTASVDFATARAVEVLGGLDAAVNLAGVGGPPSRMHEYDDDDWDRVLGVNLHGTFRCLRAQVRAMLTGGGERTGAGPRSGGSIVVVSSIGGGVGLAGAAAYATSKHGLTGLVRSAALEYATDGIRVNAVMPGFVDTDFLRARRSPQELRSLAAAHPLGRLARADEVADVVVFLASERSGFVTGSCYGVDGGFLAGSSGLLDRS